MTTFSVTGDWTSQGDVEGNIVFYPQPSSAGSPATATISAGLLSTTLTAITGSYLAVFSAVTINGAAATIESFQFASLASGTLVLTTAASPPPTAVLVGSSAATAHTVVDAKTALVSEVALANSSTETQVVALQLGPGQLVLGSAFRISVRGTVQVKSTSGTLTFAPYLGTTASTETFQMATQGSSGGPVAFFLEVDLTVRVPGVSGAYISHGYGRIELGTPVVLSTTTATTAALDTTATTTLLKLTAKWATADANNSLLVETATIKRIA